MENQGALLGKRPDIVIMDWDGPGEHLIIDVKTLEVSGATHMNVHHTDTTRLAAHAWLERTTPATYCNPATKALPPHFRLLTFTVSTSGAVGIPGQTFINEVSRRLGRSLPASLLDEASWAVPQFAPFARMAICVAVRRALAASIRLNWGSPLDSDVD